MFRYLHSDRLEELLELSDKFLMYHNNPTYALRCLDHAFSSSSLFHDMTFETLPRTLKYFKTYTELLRDCLSSTDLCDDDKAMIKLYAFGVRRLSPEEFLVFGNSMLLQDKERIQSIHTLRTMEDGLVLSLWEAQALIQDVIRKRMHSRIIMENDSCAQSQAMLVCLLYLFSLVFY